MGLFSRNRDLATTPVEPANTLGPGDTLPANASLGQRIGASGNAALGKATQFYKENPKLVGGVALVASALLLNRLRGRGLR